METSLSKGKGIGETRDQYPRLEFFYSEVFNCWKPWCSISPIAGKYVKPSKALWFTGFNNPGNTNPIPVQADVGFQGWELGADEYTTQQLTLKDILTSL